MPVSKQSPFIISIYLGLTGAGKTLSLMEEVVIPALLRGDKVVSNFWINWAGDNLSYFNDIEELKEVRNSIIVIDEIGDILDPIAYKDYTDDIKRIFRYHRKRKNIIYGTIQDISEVAKTVRIKVHSWVLFQSRPDGSFINWFFNKFFGYTRVRFNRLELSFNDLKKLTLGIGSPAIESSEDEEEEGFSEDLSDLSSKLDDEIKPELKTYNSKKLQHLELDEFKLVLEKPFCPFCQGFTEDIIKKNDLIFCSVHSYQEVFISPVGMYDTDFELPIKDVSLVWKPFYYTSKKVLSPYRSSLSPDMIKDRPQDRKAL